MRAQSDRFRKVFLSKRKRSYNSGYFINKREKLTILAEILELGIRKSSVTLSYVIVNMRKMISVFTFQRLFN